MIAIATFAHEVDFYLPDRPSTYIQLWSFPSDLNTAAKCTVLLEIPKSTVLSMAWCPLITDSKNSFFKGSDAAKTNKECLGLLAVSTDKGAVYIYRWLKL